MDHIAKIIHKEKEPKRNTEGKALSHKERKVRVARMSTNDKDKSKDKQKTGAKSSKDASQTDENRVRSRKNAEIDTALLRLLMDDMIDKPYWKFHTKCAHVLGLQYYIQLANESRDGRKPKNLFAFKLKGAIELHYKEQLYRDSLGLSNKQ